MIALLTGLLTGTQSWYQKVEAGYSHTEIRSHYGIGNPPALGAIKNLLEIGDKQVEWEPKLSKQLEKNPKPR